MFASLLVCFLVALNVWAGTERTQSVVLEPGWNAVYLEVDPADRAPDDLFANQPVDVVAAFSAAPKGAQFIDEPTVDLLRAYGWHIWYAPSRADHFLTTLHGIAGGMPFLMHATTNATLAISGTVTTIRPAWTPDAFNFTGFTVQSPGAPSFAEFFAGSDAHQPPVIYRMQAGTWRKVSDPAATSMRSGEAFWIHCAGRSDYAGPVEVTSSSRLGLQFSTSSGDAITFRNHANFPVTATLEHVVDPAAPVPLLATMLVHDQEAGTVGEGAVALDGDNWVFTMPALAPGAAVKLPLILDGTRSDFDERQSIIKVTTDIGQLQYLPVVAFGNGN